MKKILKITLVAILLTAFSCSKEDSPTQEPQQINQLPTAPQLIAPSNGDNNVDVMPTFSWQAATDLDGDTITYDVFADTSTNPNTLVGTTTNTNLEALDRLPLIETLNWKVVANDGNGGESTSAVSTFNTRSILFSNATQNADFPGRSAFASVEFDNKVWISGGFHDSTLETFRTNDVWNSNDGVNWTQITTNAQWPRRVNHSMTSFQNKLWVIGGFGTDGNIGDVWNSEDGINWTLVTDSPGFGALSNHTTTVFNDKLYVIHNSKVWFSSDGLIWTLASDGDIGSFRKRHTALVFNNKLWIIGGSEFNASSNVMSSADGITWELINNAPPFAELSNSIERSGHTSAVYDGKMWVIGGTGFPGGNDIWFSEDGNNWTLVVENGAFSKRTSHECQILNDKIWLFGGEEFPGGGARKNDVWFID